MTAIALALLVAIASAAQPARTIRGVVPAALTAPARVLWIDATAAGSSIACDMAPPASWTCTPVPLEAAGLVVIVGATAVAYIPVGVANESAHTILAWGRVLRLEPGGVAPDDVHDIRVSAWRPGRSAARPNARRFALAKDASLQVVRLSPATFWVAGNPTDPDAFLLIEGPTVASSRLAVSELADGPPDVPVFVNLVAPATLTGRVQGAGGRDAEGATVELWQPAAFSRATPSDSGDKDAKDDHADDESEVLRATTRAGAGGTFEFPRLAPDRYRVVARHETLGRGAVRVASLTDLVVVRLTPPPHATGRVWRGGAPVVGARVRFVPDPDVFRQGKDPTEQFVVDVTTDAEGRFVIALPPIRAGTLQVIANDGAIARIAIPSVGDGDLQLGDVKLADRRRVMVRLLDPAACTLYATGPLGPLGMSMQPAAGVAGTYWFDLPEPGVWILSAECGGRGFSLDPPSLTIEGAGPDPGIAVRLVRPVPRW